MAKNCWSVNGDQATFQNPNVTTTSGITYVCAESLSFKAVYPPGGTLQSLVVDGAEIGRYYRSGVGADYANASLCPGCGDTPPPDPGANPNQPCDCVNGGCVAAATYGTPGKFPSLAACRASCAKDSNCAGECVSAAEAAALKQAANQLQERICK